MVSQPDVTWRTRRTQYGHIVEVRHNGVRAFRKMVPTYAEAKAIGETVVDNILKELDASSRRLPHP